MTIKRTILTVTISLLGASAWATAAEPEKATLAATTTQPAARPIPITLARSGRQTEIFLLPIRGGRWIKKAVVLTAFGRVWFGPADVVQTSAVTRTTMTVPNVRVPTVFSIVDRRKRTVGELVAYPDRDVEWDKKITLYSSGAPVWFNQWASATGLPVKQITFAALASAKLPPSDEKGKSLLLLGQGATEKHLPDVAKLANDKGVNVLVLDARWLVNSTGSVSVAPSQMLGGLAEVAKQHWPQPLKFSPHRLPWGGIANRWAWISDKEGLPLVEEIKYTRHCRPTQTEQSTQRLVLSYIPWYRQLGRREAADATFLAILRNAAKQTTRHWRMAEVLWPKLVDIKATTRPVLSAAINAWPIINDVPSSVYILDLRGKEPPPSELLKRLNELEKLKNNNKFHLLTSLLILGDDKLLDDWKWAKIDRKKRKSQRDFVTWLPDDSLPPSKKQQIRLMQVLTEKCVKIWPTSEKEKNAKHMPHPASKTIETEAKINGNRGSIRTPLKQEKKNEKANE